ncbi:VCBS repeat-containing protein [Actibacterium sp. 188UL27-1]|nr:VCBS repeat-containing protein [Actibacterium sp. 188UL27-1]MBM7066145.1 VCBS repeat-containing protein [Actibacterium sp. 188UL27-1]
MISPADAQIVAARFEGPTARYPHAVLGDPIEHTTLVLDMIGSASVEFELPDTRVFEDVAPRLADVDRDGRPEVIVVESHQTQGARLAIYGARGLIAATPYIGQRFRWLAPIGIADLDSDGAIELAYIDRPHLAKRLRVWRYDDGRLRAVADLDGLTNHRIGERDIAGGIRDCGQGPEMVTADANWRNIMVTRLDNGQLESQPVGPHRGRISFAEALACKF